MGSFIDQYLLGSQGCAGFVAAAQAQTWTCHVTWASGIEAFCILVQPVAGVSIGSRSYYAMLKSNTGVSLFLVTIYDIAFRFRYAHYTL